MKKNVQGADVISKYLLKLQEKVIEDQGHFCPIKSGKGPCKRNQQFKEENIAALILRRQPIIKLCSNSSYALDQPGLQANSFQSSALSYNANDKSFIQRIYQYGISQGKVAHLPLSVPLPALAYDKHSSRMNYSNSVFRSICEATAIDHKLAVDIANPRIKLREALMAELAASSMPKDVVECIGKLCHQLIFLQLQERFTEYLNYSRSQQPTKSDQKYCLLRMTLVYRKYNILGENHRQTDVNCHYPFLFLDWQLMISVPKLMLPRTFLEVQAKPPLLSISLPSMLPIFGLSSAMHSWLRRQLFP